MRLVLFLLLWGQIICAGEIEVRSKNIKKIISEIKLDPEIRKELLDLIKKDLCKLEYWEVAEILNKQQKKVLPVVGL